ncbi:MAG: hypothetical protein CVV22_03690 [Ignavibacteriae bacterium HGW-Ignavibacteriae-1]|jgi:hypothetical protein|nr:MAG: hypothetical protein CVV22_03690 [Ignavibacteriae bacterium HGW-Ignavibacteriae-1]
MINFLIILYSITYFFEIFQLFSIGGSGITINDFLSFSIVVAFLIKAVWYGEEFKIPKNPVLTFFLLFCLSTFISGIGPLFRGNPDELAQFFKTTAHFHQTILFAYVLFFIRIDSAVIWKFVRIWLVLSLVVNIFGAYQIVARFFDLPLAWLDVSNMSMFARGLLGTDADSYAQLSLQFGNFFRATSIFSEPSALAAFNNILLIFMLIPFIQTKKFLFKKPLMNFMVLFWIIVSLIISFSLTGILGVVFIIGTALIFEKYSNLSNFFKSMLYFIPVIIIVEFAILSYNDQGVVSLIWERVSSVLMFLFGGKSNFIVGESFGDRFANMGDYFTLWLHYPIFGYGFGCGYMNYIARNWVFSDTTLMQVLSELGIVGFIGFFGMFISLFAQSLKFNLKNKQFKDIDPELFKLLRLGLYLSIYYFMYSYISANQIIQIHTYFLLLFIIAPINQYIIDYKGKYFIFRAVKMPLRDRLKRNIGTYIEHESANRANKINS